MSEIILDTEIISNIISILNKNSHTLDNRRFSAIVETLGRIVLHIHAQDVPEKASQS